MANRIIQLVHHNYEDLELWYPVYRLREEGYEVYLAGEKRDVKYYGKNGVPAQADFIFEDINPSDYNAILVPGGWAPDKLRRFDTVLSLIKHFNDKEKPVGHICHAGWVLISADIVREKNVTSTPGIKDDLINAGATWHDEPVVVDGHIVSSRRPADLPLYMKKFVEVLKQNK